MTKIHNIKFRGIKIKKVILEEIKIGIYKRITIYIYRYAY